MKHLLIAQIYHFQANVERLKTIIPGQETTFKFTNHPSYKDVNALKQVSIWKIINNINYKNNISTFSKKKLNINE